MLFVGEEILAGLGERNPDTKAHAGLGKFATDRTTADRGRSGLVKA